jgi:hypothetical protein
LWLVCVGIRHVFRARRFFPLFSTGVFLLAKARLPELPDAQASNVKLESYHSTLATTVVAPGHAKTIRLMPEFIAPQDGVDRLTRSSRQLSSTFPADEN